MVKRINCQDKIKKYAKLGHKILVKESCFHYQLEYLENILAYLHNILERKRVNHQTITEWQRWKSKTKMKLRKSQGQTEKLIQYQGLE